MSNQGAAILGACVIVAGVILGTNLPARSQPLPLPLPELAVGRFQIAGVPGHVYVLDTATGQVWEAYASTGSGSTDSDFKQPKVKPRPAPPDQHKDHNHDHK
jgi:hypothetical protein